MIYNFTFIYFKPYIYTHIYNIYIIDIIMYCRPTVKLELLAPSCTKLSNELEQRGCAETPCAAASTMAPFGTAAPSSSRCRPGTILGDHGD